MLNLTAIGLYMAFTGLTGVSTPAIPAQIPLTDDIAITTLAPIERQEDDKNKKVADVETYVRNYFEDIPMLAEVARCESEFRQFDKNGNILRGKVDSRDIGVMQINTHYHLEKAKKLGFDLYTIDGNLGYARHIYDEQGGRPWMASAGCWSKFKQEFAVR